MEVPKSVPQEVTAEVSPEVPVGVPLVVTVGVLPEIPVRVPSEVSVLVPVGVHLDVLVCFL